MRLAVRNLLLAAFRGASGRCAADAAGGRLDKFELVACACTQHIKDVAGNVIWRLVVILARMATLVGMNYPLLKGVKDCTYCRAVNAVNFGRQDAAVLDAQLGNRFQFLQCFSGW